MSVTCDDLRVDDFPAFEERAARIPPTGSSDDGGSNDPGETAIRQQVRMMLWAAQPPSRVFERRRNSRYAFPHLIHITPLNEQGEEVSNEEVVVVGRHLSELGLDFFYAEPLPYRRVIASFEIAGRRRTGLLLDLTWCRFLHSGWYHQGGRFLQVVPLPNASMNEG